MWCINGCRLGMFRHLAAKQLNIRFRLLKHWWCCINQKEFDRRPQSESIRAAGARVLLLWGCQVLSTVVGVVQVLGFFWSHLQFLGEKFKPFPQQSENLLYTSQYHLNITNNYISISWPSVEVVFHVLLSISRAANLDSVASNRRILTCSFAWRNGSPTEGWSFVVAKRIRVLAVKKGPRRWNNRHPSHLWSQFPLHCLQSSLKILRTGNLNSHWMIIMPGGKMEVADKASYRFSNDCRGSTFSTGVWGLCHRMRRARRRSGLGNLHRAMLSRSSAATEFRKRFTLN